MQNGIVGGSREISPPSQGPCHHPILWNNDRKRSRVWTKNVDTGDHRVWSAQPWIWGEKDPMVVGAGKRRQEFQSHFLLTPLLEAWQYGSTPSFWGPEILNTKKKKKYSYLPGCAQASKLTLKLHPTSWTHASKQHNKIWQMWNACSLLLINVTDTGWVS